MHTFARDDAFRGLLHLFTQEKDREMLIALNELDPFRNPDLDRLSTSDAFPCWLNSFVYRQVLPRDEYKRLYGIAEPYLLAHPLDRLGMRRP